VRRLYFLVTLLLVTVSGSVDPYNGANNSGRPPETAGLNHTHRYAGNTDTASNIPPNIHVIYLVKIN